MRAAIASVRARKGITIVFVWALLASIMVLGTVDWPGESVASAQCEWLCEVPGVAPGVQSVVSPRLLQGVLYVDCEAPGPGHDGLTWDTGFLDLQDALDVAGEGDEIWVAACTYYPSVEHGGTGPRYRSFQMLNDVGIYGGFDPSVGDTG